MKSFYILSIAVGAALGGFQGAGIGLIVAFVLNVIYECWEGE